MKQVFVDGKGALLVRDVPAPTAQAGEVLVQVAYSAISSGTESAALAGGGSLLRRAIKEPQLVLNTIKFAAKQGLSATFKAVQDVSESWFTSGYSAAGVVVALGAGVTEYKLGDRVTCAGFGHANHAEYIAVPTNLVAPLPPEVPFTTASFATIGAIALQGVRRAEPTIGETVVVVGSGLIGLLTAQILLANGCAVICTDLAPSRLTLAQGLGVAHVCNPSQTNAVQFVQNLTQGQGADAVIITAGSSSSAPVNQAFAMCRERGRVVLVGAVGMELERGAFYTKEIDLRMSRSYGPGRHNPLYEEKGYDFPPGYVRWTENRNLRAFVALLAGGAVRIEPLLSAEYPIEQAAAAFAQVTASPETVGVVLRYPEPSATLAVQHVWRNQARQVSQPSNTAVGIALVGAGNFAKLMHIPNLRALRPNVHVPVVVSGSGGSSRQAAEALGAASASTELQAALQDPAVQAVLINTRHHLHAQQCIQAAQAGKHIFVEKPLGLTLGECQAVLQAVELAGVLCAVGFNRRFSPLAQALHSALQQVSGPKQLLMRVNAGFLPTNHWLRDPQQGGGRIVGEGCHFFDLLTWLVGKPPVAVTAQQVGADTDELSAILTFGDGSLATLLYSGLGNSQAPKERLEVLAGNGMAVLDDFRSLQCWGLSVKKQQLTQADKGHHALLAHFVAAVQGKAALQITASDGLWATACAQAALQAARSGQSTPIVLS
jgi:predicted dehydrogenase/threonine dehydrogenase-like Zn-dependent dehydrogenase